ncbi:hypothetical protein CLV88_11628 [Shimia abyssi]|uniref:Uncharacterized protein n=1 Tax=Shimia abyssi TaxID=1662395 RepID=A0A2P8F782_9RHOB|nr:hypothetical protein CLV88_11628 [Shimia abyssi]
MRKTTTNADEKIVKDIRIAPAGLRRKDSIAVLRRKYRPMPIFLQIRPCIFHTFTSSGRSNPDRSNSSLSRSTKHSKAWYFS